ncbi:MAG: DHHA1 domain-containing protein, partial [Candidatus Nanohaloarchaea archaeon]|nr:DHHA1 domain-containing protein [Candidatus Nanohaloarchaea archaeon]
WSGRFRDDRDAREDIAAFLDVREDWSSTASIMYDHLSRLGIDPEQDVATALVHGINSDTGQLDVAKDSVHPGDFEAVASLLGAADKSVLADIENTTKSVDTIETIAKAIRNRKRDGATLFSYVEDVEDEDAIAQAAEELVDTEGIERTIIAGVTETGVRISSRNTGDQYDVGALMGEKFGDDGELGAYDCTGGGHKDMAGANIPFDDLGLFSYTYEPDGENRDFHVNLENTLVEIFELDFD